ncbi:DNA alkylation repair protein [Polaribacter vadi]|uniref:DNA alkylation repair protein n=1 Tax=Polaribacter TaxID=52959 RepID=UPI001C08336E|nr:MULTISPECIES: DNA alkylation repair protein [Polaribacter]MBU3010562.1 DNA alkylation repair protein [Polaribacter vadi]MDO6740373.1 DNA alkylation repair protein [Polaribacter sp. 1_MG-2023]
MNLTYEEIIEKLYELENQEKVIFKAQKFGIISNNSLGIYHKDLRLIAKQIGKDNQLAIELFDSGIYEARILCSKIFNPKGLTENLMEKWVRTFENWEVCDSFSMGVFAKSDLALTKILEWSDREKEFEKRAAFAIMAAYCMADKKSENELFSQFFRLIKKASSDERLYVKKAVNWALRNIGKRNIDLKKEAIKIAEELLKTKSKSAIWIAKNALTELKKEEIRMSDYPRSIYRN